MKLTLIFYFFFMNKSCPQQLCESFSRIALINNVIWIKLSWHIKNIREMCWKHESSVTTNRIKDIIKLYWWLTVKSVYDFVRHHKYKTTLLKPNKSCIYFLKNTISYGTCIVFWLFSFWRFFFLTLLNTFKINAKTYCICFVSFWTHIPSQTSSTVWAACSQKGIIFIPKDFLYMVVLFISHLTLNLCLSSHAGKLEVLPQSICL